MTAVLRAVPRRLSRAKLFRPACKRLEVLKEGASSVIGVTGFAPSVFANSLSLFDNTQGFVGGRVASVSVVRSEGRRFEGLGWSGEVCVWTIFQSAPTFW